MARTTALALAMFSVMLGSACITPKTLTRDQVDSRSQEYYLRGMDQYQRGEFRPALESFRLAKAYDIQGLNPQIPEMIEKAEAKLRINSGPTLAGPALGSARAPTPTPQPSNENAWKTYHSQLYPYAIDVPENWTFESAGAKADGAVGDLFVGPASGSGKVSLSIVAHLLPPDFDGRAYVEANLKLMRGYGAQVDLSGKKSIDGFEATIGRFSGRPGEKGKLEYTFALFASDRIGWALTFEASSTESAKLQPLFHRILDSFHIDTEKTV